MAAEPHRIDIVGVTVGTEPLHLSGVGNAGSSTSVPWLRLCESCSALRSGSISALSDGFVRSSVNRTIANRAYTHRAGPGPSRTSAIHEYLFSTCRAL